MSTSVLRIFLGILLLAAVPQLQGCRGSRDSYEEVAKAARSGIDEGKQLLAQQQYFDAVAKFDEVIREVDTNNNEARLGKVIGELLQFVSIIRLINQVAGVEPAGAENDFILSLVRDFLGDMIDRFESIAFELTVLKSDPYVQIVLPSTPVFLTSSDTASLNLGGEWDRSEVFLLDALIQPILGILKTVDAIDLNADFLGIYNHFVDLDISFGDAPSANLDDDPNKDTLDESLYNVMETIEKPLPKIQNLIAWIMNKNANFLGIRSDGGKEEMQQAGAHFASTIDSLQKALFFASYDAQFDLDQSDDVIAWGTTAKKYGGKYEVPPAIDPDVDLCAVRGTDNESTYTYNFTFNFGGDTSTLESKPDTGCLLSLLKQSLENDGTRINFMDDIFPIVLSVISSNLDTGLAPDLIESIVRPVIEDTIGNSIELDFGPMFAAPKGIRNMLPAWDDPSVEPDENNWMLLMESECRWDTSLDRYGQDRLAYKNAVSGSPMVGYHGQRVLHRIFCQTKPGLLREMVPANAWCGTSTGDANLCDGRHFPVDLLVDANAGFRMAKAGGALSSLPDDGVEGILPYIYWNDASFNGILWLDVNNLAVTDNNAKLLAIDPDPEFSLATNSSFNAFLARVSSKVNALLGAAGSLGL